MLRKSATTGRQNFVFILGNHEFWNFSGVSVDEIVEKYRTVLKENGMYLLHNDVFYRNEYDDIGIIQYDELIRSDNRTLLEKLRCTRLVILGGLGFSGYNEEFNANDGVYRTTVDRNTEIQESKKFEQLYDKLTDVLAKKNTVIFTHMPKKDWCVDANCHDDFVYVSGHTHKNMFFDDGVKRIYADNQIGYRNESPHLKNFLMDGEYDYFGDYEDGIYEITSQEYQDFYRGKNISMTFNRQVNKLYMLKKNGYYCYIHKSKTGSLSMLNGGALKKLDMNDVNYYYENMDSIIASIETPLKKYTAYQESIAKELRRIGGYGLIHGCIIDIDYYNHVSQRLLHRARGNVPTAESRKEVLYVRDMSGKYLDHFQFSVYKGECLVIQSLDTRMYNEFLEILEKEGGFKEVDMLVEGKKVSDYRTRKIAFMKEEVTQTMLFDDLTVRDNICIGLDRKAPNIWLKKRIQKSVQEEYYRIFGEDIFDCYINELSDEQKTRVIYMRILLEKPEVVFMVQPFKHAGTPHRLQVWELQTLLLERGVSIVILAMNMSDSLTIADRVIRISRVDGKMVTKEFAYSQFAELPMSLPWVGFFDELKNSKEEL